MNITLCFFATFFAFQSFAYMDNEAHSNLDQFRSNFRIERTRVPEASFEFKELAYAWAHLTLLRIALS